LHRATLNSAPSQPIPINPINQKKEEIAAVAKALEKKENANNNMENTFISNNNNVAPAKDKFVLFDEDMDPNSQESNPLEESWEFVQFEKNGKLVDEDTQFPSGY
jgi:hypothetical protein